MSSHRVLIIFVTALSLCGSIPAARAQALRDLKLQFHGYATESFIYSNQNNWNTTNSTGNGSFRWTEAVGNVSAQPTSRLRFGAQGRFFLLGAYGPKVTLDWVLAEFKVNERLGFRAGKVKSPGGLLNEIQDIDPAYLWILLPQSMYPLSSRNGNLAVRGGLVFGSLPLGEKFGKLEYRAFGGERTLAADDGYFDAPRGAGILIPQGTHGSAVGGNLIWKTPLPGLLVGFADGLDKLSGNVLIGTLTGRLDVNPSRMVSFGRYERRKLMVAGEYSRFPYAAIIQLARVPSPPINRADVRNFYVMTSYKLASKLTGGAYYSSSIDLQSPAAPSRYQKDWTVSGRYDFNSFLYLKLEQHFLDGTGTGFSTSNNPNGLQETSRLSFAKLGVTF